MDSKRLEKISRQIQKDMGEILQRHSAGLLAGRMVTVSQVRVTPDLSIAKVFVSIFPSQGKEAVLQALEAGARSLRHELAQRVRNQLRIVPELLFRLDDSLDYIENIDRLLNPKGPQG